MDKRGQGLPINAFILIILGVVVLVVLIVGFTVGWSKIIPWISKNNVQNIVTACETACSTQGVYDYCSMERELNDGTNKIKTSCFVFAHIVDYAKYGVNDCENLCNLKCTDVKIDDKGASEEATCASGEKQITLVTVDIATNKCCI